MGVNGLPRTVTRQRRGCDLNPGPTAPEFSTLTARLPSHPGASMQVHETSQDAVEQLAARVEAIFGGNEKRWRAESTTCRVGCLSSNQLVD